MPGESAVNLGKDRKLGVIDLAVDIDRYQFFCCLFNLGKELAHAGRLSGAGKSLADAVERAPPAQSRADLERKLAHLGIAELELFRNIVELEDFGITKQRLLPHQQVLFHLTFIFQLPGY